MEPVTLRRDERELYAFFEEKIGTLLQASAASNLRRTSNLDKTMRATVFTFMMFLRRICNHGADLLPKSALELWNRQHITGRSDATMASLTALQSYGNSCEVCGEDLETPEILESEIPGSRATSLICNSCVLINSGTQIADEASAERNISKSPAPLAPTASKTISSPSSKICALLKNLHDEQASHKQTAAPIKRYPTAELTNIFGINLLIHFLLSVVFTSWTGMIDMIETSLRCNGFLWQRIDGRTVLKSRSEAMRRFNEDPNCTVMLASIGSAGEG